MTYKYSQYFYTDAEGTRKKHPFRRPCERCGDYFRPEGSHGRFCKKCLIIKRREGNDKRNRNYPFCSDCGAKCMGKFQIEARKNVFYPFCSNCFVKCELMNLKQIRARIRNKVVPLK
ncbi:hypothetical protein LCGC14_0439430 [marine sediment metagenome]|uniref:Uncharacterized protein n=1 Tax=marine sediment metagenome TaxID=412755 RepID=A0A0F9SKY9_9ZZZZ